MRFLIINGPNLNMLGLREPDIYGCETYNDLVVLVNETACLLSCDVDCFQSNHEGVLIDKIQDAYGNYDGIIINPGGYTHTSVALLDALLATGLPYVEVHISDIRKREQFRSFSYFSERAVTTIMGKGLDGYREALVFLHESLAKD